MTLNRFPRGVSQALGKFWVSGDKDSERFPGFCRIEGSSVVVEVTDPLTRTSESSVGAAYAPLDEVDDFDLQGSLAATPNKISLLGAYVASRETTYRNFLDSQDEDTTVRKIRADWAIVGTHAVTSASKFTAVRARFTHLEMWAEHGQVKMLANLNSENLVTYQRDRVKSITTPFTQFSETANIGLGADAKWSSPKHSGARIRTKNWIGLEELSGWTLNEAFERFIHPVKSLMAILSGEKSDVLEIEVLVDDHWRPVYGDNIVGEGDSSDDNRVEMMLDRGALSLDYVGQWCGTATLLSPASSVVETSIEGAFPAVDVEALALTTSAEGVDNVLHPDSRRFTEEEVKDATGALKESAVSKDIRNLLSSALKNYLYKENYSTRMKLLADDVKSVASECIGDPKEWGAAVSDLRNGLAHSNLGHSDMTDEVIRSMHARARSLRWVLLIRLLQHTGVSDGDLQSALVHSRRYRRDTPLWDGLFVRDQSTGE